MILEAPSWLVAWLQSINLWDLLLIGAAVTAAVMFVRRKGWRTVKALARGILNAADVLEAVQGSPEFQARVEEFIQRTDERLDGIHHETHNNDGSSLKDSQDRTEKAITRIEASLEGVHGRLDPVEADLLTVKTSVIQLQAADDELRAELEHTQPSKGTGS